VTVRGIAGAAESSPAGAVAYGLCPTPDRVAGAGCGCTCPGGQPSLAAGTRGSVTTTWFFRIQRRKSSTANRCPPFALSSNSLR
jgi:hypothetical protein